MQRRTEHLDLLATPLTKHLTSRLEHLRSIILHKKRVVVVAGAGISVSAGVPDFRSGSGLFSRCQPGTTISGKGLFEIAVYDNPSLLGEFHRMITELWEKIQAAGPTPFHHMLDGMAELGRLQRLYTQNIDAIDVSMPRLATSVPLQRTGGKWPRTVQMHGSLDRMYCTKCSHLYEFDVDLFRGAEEAPLCAWCTEDEGRRAGEGRREHGVGRLRPRITLYGEQGHDRDALAAVIREDIRAGPDAIIVVGTTLKAPGARALALDMCRAVRNADDGGLAVWINVDRETGGEDFQDCWDFVVRGRADQLPEQRRRPTLLPNKLLGLDKLRY